MDDAATISRDHQRAGLAADPVLVPTALRLRRTGLAPVDSAAARASCDLKPTGAVRRAMFTARERPPARHRPVPHRVRAVRGRGLQAHPVRYTTHCARVFLHRSASTVGHVLAQRSPSPKHRAPPVLPPWVNAADILTVLLGVAALQAAVFGGFQISIRNPWRPLLWAVLLCGLRHYLVRTAPMHERLRHWTRRVSWIDIRRVSWIDAARKAASRGATGFHRCT